MKIALKYGLLITIVVVLWVILVRFIFPVSPESPVNMLAPILFNLAAIVAIYFGIRARGRKGAHTFKEGLSTGLSISFVYAVSSCLFFFVLYLIVGPKLLASEPLAQVYPLWQVALFSYAGMFFGALLAGLIFSTVISFFMVRTRRNMSDKL